MTEASVQWNRSKNPDNNEKVGVTNHEICKDVNQAHGFHSTKENHDQRVKD